MSFTNGSCHAVLCICCLLHAQVPSTVSFVRPYTVLQLLLVGVLHQHP